MTSIIITILIVLYKIPLINILGDKGIGYYSVALSLYMLFMTCISYGVPKALSTLLIEQSSKGKYALVYKTTISAFIYALVSGLFFALLTFVGADIFAKYIFNADQSVMAIRAFAPSFVFISFLGVFQGVYTGTKAGNLTKKIRTTEDILVPLLCILIAYIAKSKADLLNEPLYSSTGAALGFTCGIFITFIISLILFINYRKKLLRTASKDSNTDKTPKKAIIFLLMKTMIPFMLTVAIYHLSNVLDYAVFNGIMSVQGHKENSYIILLGILNGKYEFFISVPLLFVSWYAASTISSFKKIAEEGNKRKIFHKISKSIRSIMLYIMPCTAIFILFAKPLMDLIFTGINDTSAILLRTGAISIVFYSLASLSNAVLSALDEWAQVVKNALIALVIQLISLLIMMIVFQWSIIAVVVSRILFSASLFVLNEHSLRERISYVLEKKRSFSIPLTSTLIMSVISFVIYFIFQLFIGGKIAVIIALFVAIPAYILALIFTGGITQREMYRLPGGKYLAPLCKKLHLIK